MFMGREGRREREREGVLMSMESIMGLGVMRVKNRQGGFR